MVFRYEAYSGSKEVISFWRIDLGDVNTNNHAWMRFSMPATQLPLSCLTRKRLGYTLVNLLPVQVYFLLYMGLQLVFILHFMEMPHIWQAKHTIQNVKIFLLDWFWIHSHTLFFSICKMKGWMLECGVWQSSNFLWWQSSIAVWGQILTTNDFVVTKLFH